MSDDGEAEFSEACRIEHRENFDRFAARLEKWRSWMTQDDHHAISKQVYEMMWSDAQFRLINETWHTPNEEHSAFNGMLGEALVRGFFATQIIAIRGLIDKSNNVISLPRILTDMRDNAALFSREAYVCAGGYPYDYALAKVADQKASAARYSGIGATWRRAEPREQYQVSERAHKRFDILADVLSDARNRSDSVPASVFQGLIDRLEVCGARQIVKAAHKFYLHPADANSRRSVRPQEMEIVLEKLDHIHRTIVHISEFIYTWLLGEGTLGNVVPTANFDVLNKMHLPFIGLDRVDELNEWWDKHCIERDNWLNGAEQLAPTRA